MKYSRGLHITNELSLLLFYVQVQFSPLSIDSKTDESLPFCETNLRRSGTRCSLKGILFPSANPVPAPACQSRKELMNYLFANCRRLSWSFCSCKAKANSSSDHKANSVIPFSTNSQTAGCPANLVWWLAVI